MTDEAVLLAFRALGQIPLPVDKVEHAPLSALLARQNYFYRSYGTEIHNPVEVSAIEMELAQRCSGKEPLLS